MNMNVTLEEKEDVVYDLARTMNINYKHMNFHVICQCVQWRIDRRCIILTWKKVPNEIASLIMCFLGNEKEQYEEKERKERKRLKKFNKKKDLYLECKANLAYVSTNPRMNTIVASHMVESLSSKLYKYARKLLKIAGQMESPPDTIFITGKRFL